MHYLETGRRHGDGPDPEDELSPEGDHEVARQGGRVDGDAWGGGVTHAYAEGYRHRDTHIYMDRDIDRHAERDRH